MAAPVDQARRAVERAEGSTAVDRLARVGLVARGVVYLLVGVLAVQVAIGGGGEADRQGALGAVKAQPFGELLLVVLAVGFGGYALWRLLEAAAGHRSESGGKRVLKRLASAGRGLLYAGLTVSTARFVASGPRRDTTKPAVAQLMAEPAGQWLVGLVGLAVVVGGLAMVRRGLLQKFLKRLDPRADRRAVKVIGIVGLVGRGLVLALLGGFLIEAAWTFDPNKAKGLDAALKSLAAEPYGQLLIGLAALGLAGFGAWSFVEARYRRI